MKRQNVIGNFALRFRESRYEPSLAQVAACLDCSILQVKTILERTRKRRWRSTASMGWTSEHIPNLVRLLTRAKKRGANFSQHFLSPRG